MISTEGSESVARPAADVFAFIADVRNDPRWHTDVLEARLTEGESVAEGSTFVIKTKPVMGVSGGTVTVAQYEAPRRVVFDVRMGKMEPTTTMTVAPDGAGCRVTRRIEMEPPGLMRLMAPFMGGMFRKRNVGFLANLKRTLESDR
jgi:carbon monoxide dehydrogenase subunit G